jgi:hypothetical protein
VKPPEASLTSAAYGAFGRLRSLRELRGLLGSPVGSGALRALGPLVAPGAPEASWGLRRRRAGQEWGGETRGFLRKRGGGEGAAARGIFGGEARGVKRKIHALDLGRAGGGSGRRKEGLFRVRRAGRGPPMPVRAA